MMSAGTGLMGLWNAAQGHKGQMELGKNMPTADELKSTFSGTSDIIGNMTNFGQYAAPAMDMWTQAGNKGVETSLSLGQGGSQANAIRNRLNKAGLNQAYQNFTKGLGDAARLQYGIDQNVFSQLNQNRDTSRNIAMGGLQRQIGIGKNLMGPKGVAGVLGQIGGLFG